MFCGHTNLFDEDAVDLHYFQDCPLLTTCSHCDQIVEIQHLTDHLLVECSKSKNEYQQCERTRLAIHKNDWNQWLTTRPDYSNVLDNDTGDGGKKSVCPLCYDIIVNNNDNWRLHLMSQCSNNYRKNK